MTKLFSIAVAIICILLSPAGSFAQDFDELNEQADKEYAGNNFQNAIELSTRAINLKVNPRSYFIRADSRFSLKDYETALDDFNSAISNYSSYYTTDKYKGRLYYWRARCKQKLERYTDAINDFGTSFDYNFEDAGYAYWNRGNCYYQLEKYKESDDDYAKAIDRISASKDLGDLYKYRGDCNGKLADYASADKFYTRAISYNPDNYLAYWQRGYYKDLENKYEEALADYNKTIDIISASSTPSSGHNLSILYRNRALIYKSLIQYDSALAAINTSLQTDPNYINAYKTRAEIYTYQKKQDKAKADYGNAISLEKDKGKLSDLYLTRSMIEMDVLDYKSTLEDLNKAIEFGPEEGMNYWHRAILFGNKKNYLLGIKDCSIAITKYLDDSFSIAGLSKLRASFKDKVGDYTGAVEDYQFSLKYNPDSYDTYYNLGRLFKTKMKNNDVGEANLSKAAELAEKDHDTSMYCYIKVIKGDREEAIKTMLQKAENAKNNKDSYPGNSTT